MSYGTKVELIASTPDAEHLIEKAGRLCYATDDKTGMSPGWLQKRIADGHLSLVEHAHTTWHITCSRVTSHQLVRHRIASYSQRSQRYVKESEPRYIIPPQLSGALETVFRDAMKAAWYTYETLLLNGVPPDQARYVLPNATETQLIMTMNFRELHHFLSLRTSSKASEEMQEVANSIKRICQEMWPNVFGSE
ncbi:hypothetical protein LCGC14_1214230 [marine sediment metagenome]|uniref:Thymidylate synthase (FAD) n=1 Tax=marine sediment metagenome TaxID=412755 RepID=A0A0F9M0K4_9ZZZZ